MNQLALLDVQTVEVPEGASDEFWTPRGRFMAWNRRYSFTVDVAATAENALLPKFFTQLDDGLSQSWSHERVWCNPPYSNITPWIEKTTDEMFTGACVLVAQLLPNWTDRKWWQKYIEPKRDVITRTGVSISTIFMPRLRFGFHGDPTGKSGMGAKFGSVLVVWERGRI